MIQNINNGLIIFGGTGDLTKRKLMPAIYNLLVEDILPEDFFVVAIGRRDISRDDYVSHIIEAIKSYSRNKIDHEKIERIKGLIYYFKMNFAEVCEYQKLGEFIRTLEQKHNTKGNLLYYLAVSPEFFGVIADNLYSCGLTDDTNGYKRVMIEKPFGSDLDTAKELNQKIANTFEEKNTYRIDHYLGKEMLQNIMVIRFANSIFEPLWNSKYIDHVQITSSETLGVSDRAGYYEKAGALKDMLQNHLLQFLALTAMESPKSLDATSVIDEKIEVFKNLSIYDEDDISGNVIRGQYDSSSDGSLVAYRDEHNTDESSETETFVAIKAKIDNDRWKGVPFYIRTGKRMKSKCINVIIQFKCNYNSLYFEGSESIAPNQLIIRIQPEEGVYLKFNAKKPGQSTDVIPIQMDFCQNCQIGYNSPEAYERLLFEAMKGEKALFTRWDEVEYSWEFVETIKKAWSKESPQFPNYAAGTNGPKISIELIEKDGREWINPQ